MRNKLWLPEIRVGGMWLQRRSTRILGDDRFSISCCGDCMKLYIWENSELLHEKVKRKGTWKKNWGGNRRDKRKMNWSFLSPPWNSFKSIHPSSEDTSTSHENPALEFPWIRFFLFLLQEMNPDAKSKQCKSPIHFYKNESWSIYCVSSSQGYRCE